MIECIFTIDYEIYGDGEGALKQLVLDPTQRLIEIFEAAGVPFVCFVEALEIEKIEEGGTDPASAEVRRQIKDLYHRDFEIALHLHPQWARARIENGRWLLDFREYNLCTLGVERIAEIVDQAIAYLREVLEDPAYSPLSFRAGNWLFQPTKDAAKVLASRGIRLDTSAFKGGMIHSYQLDYRPAASNGYYWPFDDDVNVPRSGGRLLEIPIHTEMVPFWKMLTAKRLGIRRKSAVSGGGPNRTFHSIGHGNGAHHTKRAGRFTKLRDYLRLSYPLKFDFCRMTLSEMTAMVEKVIREDQNSPEVFRPLVAIGHSKDLVDFDAIKEFLAWLKHRDVPVSTLEAMVPKCTLP